MVCRQCSAEFKVTNEELTLFDKVAPVINGQKYTITSPALCFDCHRQNMYAFRNERKFYLRKCDLCHKQIVSLYNGKTSFPVYCSQCWWSDKWDRSAFGIDYDFSKTFFENFSELLKKMPRLAIINSKSENSEYTNFSDKNKNCYMVVGAGEDEDCAWCYRIFRSRDVHDSSQILDCELCFECIDCEKLYFSKYCQNCSNSKYLQYCFECKGCENCFGCSNLINQKYHFFNQQLTKEKYKKSVAEAEKRGWETVDKIKSNAIVRNLRILQSENSSGDNLVNDRDCQNCFNLSESRDCAECNNGNHNSDCTHSSFFDNNELCGFSASLEEDYNILFSFLIWYCQYVYYSMECFNSSNLFGCLGLNHKEFCILNKQYPKDEYYEKVEQIIDQMKTTGEWGSFFPSKISPFGYNETIANEYFLMGEDEAKQRQLNWHQQEETVTQETKDAIKCEKTGRLFKVQKTELDFLHKLDEPLPHFHPDYRHQLRNSMKNAFKLYSRTCANCKAPIQTTYAPDRPEIVYCEKCYLEKVY